MDFIPYEWANKERTLVKCRGCGNLISCETAGVVRKIFCSKKCYKLQPKAIKKSNAKRRIKSWAKKHPERMKRLMKENYRKNKPKWIIRQVTNIYRDQIIDSRNNECENCSAKENLEIHHLKYTLNFEDWQVLCKKCHKLITSISLTSKMIEKEFSS